MTIETDRKILELTTLYEVAKLASSSLDLDTTLGSILHTLSVFLEMGRGTLTLLDPATGVLQVRASYGLTAGEMRRGTYKVGEGVTGKVFETGRPFIVPDVKSEPLFLNRTGSRGDIKKENISFIGVPVKVNNRVIGVLSVDRLFSLNVNYEEDVRLLNVVASIIGQTVMLHRMIKAEKDKLVRENSRLKDELGRRYSLPNIIGSTDVMQEVFRTVGVVSGSQSTALIRGESGTGKELVAKAIHYMGKRSKGPFIKFNCAAIPEGLLESELFGHEKGAFTGAVAAKKGRFEMAQGGTIFLDEIGDLPLSLQPKMLRVLQEHEFERVGGERTMKVDIRVIAATSRDLETLMSAGQFREDLYYRLNVVPIFIPPLRDRAGDIPELVDHFARKVGSRTDRKVRLTQDAVVALARYPWPGNVRELENVVERTIVMSGKDVIDVTDLKLVPVQSGAAAGNPRPAGTEGLPQAVQEVELRSLKDALSRTGWRQAAAARLLGITPRQIGYRIIKYGLTPPSEMA
ncbi:MAG: nif-specific transcriptional activator NifA [Nitrospirae bacterium]|nr:nif-specific transcriptional activator NifA [Nitrospirota bacterium]